MAKGSQRGFPRRDGGLAARRLLVSVDSGDHAYRGGFQIAFHTSYLAGQVDARMRADLHGDVQRVRGIDVSVTVHDAKANEFGILEARNHLKDSLLLTPLEPALESHQSPKRSLL